MTTTATLLAEANRQGYKVRMTQRRKELVRKAALAGLSVTMRPCDTFTSYSFFAGKKNKGTLYDTATAEAWLEGWIAHWIHYWKYEATL